MTDIGYMTRKYWADHAQGMERNSRRVIEWLAHDGRHGVLVGEVSSLQPGSHSCNRETAEFLALSGERMVVAAIGDLGRLSKNVSLPLAVLHPRREGDLEAMRVAVLDKRVDRLFVMLWSPTDHDALALLQALGATNLATGRRTAPLDPLIVEAARMMVDEEYNGIGGGRGKDVTLSLLHALRADGLPMDAQIWVAAILRAGGDWRSVQTLRKFVTEIRGGTRHRYKNVMRADIVDVLRGTWRAG
jgi:hypothetical protein